MTVVFVCGLYISQKECLPLVNTEAYTTILDNVSRTKLTQTYVNPSEYRLIPELKYNFPLYDGVSVVSFKCQIGDRTIIGQVKEREKAKKEFREAVGRGEKAAILEQSQSASDVFSTTVGNVPAGAQVVVEITYIGELKHDAEVDGIRFTIPTKIMPRYGSYPLELVKGGSKYASGSKINLTVDVVMAEKSFIKQIQSPSHPIAISLGTTSLAPNADPVMYKASAALTLDDSGLEKDFIVNVIAKNTGIPTAILETHPTIPGQRALMATLVPRFSLPPEKPEIVLICDRSGSMAGSRMNLAKSALKVFLKSIPVGAKFNICSFGSSHSFLWSKSQAYTENTLQEALNHVERMEANLGGTEMFNPLKATIDARYSDLSLEIMLLTDGEIWDQERLFSYLNGQVKDSKGAVRVFTLGIGNGVSHALIEGVAKAGSGFSQSVGEGEKMDSKVVRMLKGALSPHVSDYTMEVKYVDEKKSYDSDDDFELVEKVTDCLKIDTKVEKKNSLGSPQEQKVISLFDTSVDLDKDVPAEGDNTGESRYSHLPELEIPKLLQAPHDIPPLYAFNRTSVYVLMSPECTQLKPKSVILKGTSRHGPLVLEIPIQILDTPGETIHQLAARKATTELEQGRGWIMEAKGSDNVLLKKKYESKFTEMIEREAVRLGVQFQIQGKWTSFVATETNPDTKEKLDSEPINISYSAAESTPIPTPPAYNAHSAYPAYGANLRSSAVQSARGGGGGTGSWGGGGGFFKSKSSSARSASSIPTGAGFLQTQSLAGPQALGYTTSGLDKSTKRRSRSKFSFSKSAAVDDVVSSETDNSSTYEGLLSQLKARAEEMNKEVDQQNARLEKMVAKTDIVYGSTVEKGKVSNGAFGGAFGSLFKRKSGSPQDLSSIAQPYNVVHLGYKPSSPPQITPNSSNSVEQANSCSDNFDFTYPSSGKTYYSGSTYSGSAYSGSTYSGSASPNYSSVLPQAPAPGNPGPYQSQYGSPAPTYSYAPPPPPVSANGPGFGSVSTPAPPGLFSSPIINEPMAPPQSSPAPAPISKGPTKSALESLIDLQSFEGFWKWDQNLFSILGISIEKATELGKANQSLDQNVLATSLVIAYFENKLLKDKDVWELVSDKAKTWMEGEVGAVEAEALLEKASALVA